MKSFIFKINNYLIERYPTLWNTKVIWMLSSALVLHIIFYIFGWFALSNPETLHSYRASGIFFENGTIYFSLMISIVMLVLWLVFMFKNNAFKNFYPFTAFKLFKQFIIYFVIIITSISYYFSFNLGVKNYINYKYPDASYNQDISIANKASVFFSHNLSHYTIDKIVYPEPFNNVYCETNYDKINFDKPVIKNLGKNYQFYSLKTKTYSDTEDFQPHLIGNYLYYVNLNNQITYTFKDSVIDLSSQLKTVAPNYYNYSNVFFNKTTNNGYSEIISYDYDLYETRYKNKSLKPHIQKENFELLNRNNPEEIKSILNQFLDIAKTYKIQNNLNANTWFDLIYNPVGFEIKNLIHNEKPYVNYRYLKNVDNSIFEDYQAKLFTNYYIESDNLKKAFDNINSIKSNPILGEEVHFFMWISFFIALVIFCFRVTSLKAILFTIVSSIILTIFVSLVTAAVAYTTRHNSIDIEYFISYFIWIIGTILLVLGIFFITRIKKQIAAIILNICLIGITPYLGLILAIITMHQSDRCRDLYPKYSEREEYCHTLFDYLGIWSSYIIFVLGLIFIYLFCKNILKWRSTPEN